MCVLCVFLFLYDKFCVENCVTFVGGGLKLNVTMTLFFPKKFGDAP